MDHLRSPELTGVAFLMGSLGAGLPVLIFVAIIRNNFDRGEGRFPEASLGRNTWTINLP